MLVMQVKVAWGLFYLTQQKKKSRLRNLKTLEKKKEAQVEMLKCLVRIFITLSFSFSERCHLGILSF